MQKKCKGRRDPPGDIARQLVEENEDINVVLGGGQRNFYPETAVLPSDNSTKGRRLDGRYLTEEWLATQLYNGRRAAVLNTPTELFTANLSNIDYLLGRFKG